MRRRSTRGRLAPPADGRPGLAIGLAVVLLAAGATQPLWALEPLRSIRQYGHDRWRQDSGLPGSAVRSLFQLPDGYIWLHSGGNLFRFDGVRFVQIHPEVGGKPIGEAIRVVGLGPGNKLLVRSMTRTLHLENGKFTDAMPPLRLPDGVDMAICETRDGSIWVASDNSIYRARDGRFELVVNRSGWTRAMLEDSKGSVWIASIGALHRFRNGRLTRFPPGYERPMEEIRVPQEPPTPAEVAIKLPQDATALAQDRAGTLWIGSLAGLWKMKGGAIIEDADTLPMKGRYISALLEDRSGNLWAGTNGQGLFRLSHGKWSSFATPDGLSDDNVVSLQEDREGSLWIGTRTGLDRLRNTPVLTLTAKEGLSNDNVACVVEAPDGSLYVFTEGGGITRIKDGRTSVIDTRNGLPKDVAGNLFLSADGTVWAGMDRGLASIKDGHLKTFTSGTLASVYISAIAEDDESLILACADLNLYRFRDGRLSPYDLRLAASGGAAGTRYVFTMLRDAEGTLWFGMTAGLYRLGRHDPPEKAVRTVFAEAAQTLYDDGLGYIWITSRDLPGFSRLSKRDGTLFRYTPEVGAAVDGASRILSDSAGNLWMASNDGIHTFLRADLNAIASGRGIRLEGRKYGTIDGLQTEDSGVMGLEPSAWRGRDGRLYFASRKGLVQIDADRLPRNSLVPPVHVEELVVDKQVQAEGAVRSFAPGRENFEIHYSAPSLEVPSRVRFKYQLVGYDPGWVDAGTSRTAYYTRLPPGSYLFRVIACNNDGLWNEAGASLAFALRPHFYQTVWFFALVILAVLGSIVSVFQLRIRRHRQAEQVLQVRIAEALVHIKTLHGMLPICAWCKKVREDTGYWSQIEEYISKHTTAEFSHGICPDCKKRYFQHSREQQLGHAGPTETGGFGPS